jgi:hypothetical protein
VVEGVSEGGGCSCGDGSGPRGVPPMQFRAASAIDAAKAAECDKEWAGDWHSNELLVAVRCGGE